MKVDCAPGEVADRITILELKAERLRAPHARERARELLAGLHLAWTQHDLPALDTLSDLPRLRALNAALWEVEDALRAHEREGRFDPAFVDLARSVYRLNDARAEAKAAIDRAIGSALTEPKGY